jgi:hypothetical protein
MKRFTLTTIAIVTLGLLHLTSPAIAQTNGMIGTEHTIAVGGNPNARAGYCTAPACGTAYIFGSISPATTPEPLTIASFVDLPRPRETGYDRTELAIAGFSSDPGKNWLSQASCGTVTYVGASATRYFFVNGQATWQWVASNGAQSSFQGRSSVSCTISRSGAANWLTTKYQVVGLTYAPPGSRSTATYSSGFINGTATNHGSSFQTGISQEISLTTGGGLFGILDGSFTQTFSAGWKQTRDSSSSLTISQQTSSGLIVPGPASSAAGVDHDYDTIYVWVNPAVFMMVFPTKVVVGGYGWNARDPVSGMDVVPLTVGQLRGTQPIAPNTWTRLNRSWDPQLGALTTADFQLILRANPFAINPAYNPNADPTGRYELPLSGNPPAPANLILNYVPAPPGGQPTGQTYSSSYSSTSGQGRSSKDEYTASYSISGTASFDFLVKFEQKLKTTSSITYANQWSQTATNGASQSANFTIFPPFAADNYVGPTAIQVWKDNVYGTFMFYPQY